MIEIKLSQGAKPGHGGILPGHKVSAEIAATRGVREGQDCISPAAHSAFRTRWSCCSSSPGCASCQAANR
jgi:glutamate synthase domain-containing protein 2